MGNCINKDEKESNLDRKSTIKSKSVYSKYN